MKSKHKVAVAALVGIAIGVAGAKVIRGQQTSTPPGYVIAEVEVTDPTTMRKYGDRVAETMEPFHHHFVVRGGKTQALEGEPPKSIIVIAFDSVEKAREWYDSPAYSAIRPIRQSASKSRLFIVEGVAAQ
jgi:uncharacterized protein (DUF1330 family)